MDRSPADLGWRERQIVDLLYRLGEASVTEIRRELPDPPSYSAVRAMLNVLVQKKVAAYRKDGKRYLYRAIEAKSRIRESALRNLVRNFFGGQAADAVAALIDGTAGRLADDDLDRLRRLIDETRKKP
jgi:predicted transcriptional regulator